MKLYFKNLIHDIKVTLDSIRHWGTYSFHDMGTIYLQWEVIRMLSLKYPDGEFDITICGGFEEDSVVVQ